MSVFFFCSFAGRPSTLEPEATASGTGALAPSNLRAVAHRHIWAPTPM
ncbi:hypothetical protein [Myxococcus sp. CA033]|nr:hypothetical protein [Myxococcus sp. CA033]